MTYLDFCHIQLYVRIRGDSLKEYEQCFELVKTYIKDETLGFSVKKLDLLITKELDKPIHEMDTHLINLCLNALVAYRAYISENEK